MSREINIPKSYKKKSKKRFIKRNRSPINLGMVVMSPKKQPIDLGIKNKSKKFSIINKSSVQNLSIRSPSKPKDSNIEKYIKITKKIVPKSYNRFSNRLAEKKNSVTSGKKFKKVKFRFCKNLYKKTTNSYFNLAVLDNVIDKLDYYKNLPPEDRYICSSISNNIIIDNNDIR